MSSTAEPMADRTADRTADRLAIEETLCRYANALADRDWEAWRAAFHEDATVDYQAAGGPAGSVDDAVAWLSQLMPGFDLVLPQLTNAVITFVGDDEATVRAMYRNVMRFPGADGAPPVYVEAQGWYADRVRRGPTGWRLAHRQDLLSYVR